MDKNQILESLAQLEKSIIGVNSAKEQVESVVKAYGDASVSLKSLTKSITEVKNNLNEMLKALKDKEIILDSEAKEILKRFETSCNELFSHFAGVIDDKVRSLNDVLVRFNNTLRDFQSSVASLLKSISGVTKAIKDSEQVLLNDIMNKSQSMNTAIDNNSKTIQKDVADNSKKILKSETEILNQLSNVHNLANDIKSAEAEFKVKLDKLDKRLKTNRLLFLILIVIAAISVFLH